MTENRDTIEFNDDDANQKRVIDALARASALYERYVEIVDVANVAAFQSARPLVHPNTIAPLGLVLWSDK